jgi:hypothetical protein
MIPKECDLHEGKICVNCVECDLCDLDRSKICNNCGACISTSYDYNGIIIDDIIINIENEDLTPLYTTDNISYVN